MRLIKEVADLLLDLGGAGPLFVGGALQSWLSNGGNLERDFFQVTAAPGSKRTPAAIAAEMEGEDIDS